MRKALAYLAASACLLALAPARASAWGDDGHKTVAAVAYKLLTPRARKNVDAVLEGKTLDGVAMWADDVKYAGKDCPTPESAGCNTQYRPETAQWHYVDIPYEEERYDAARDCPPSRYGDCAVLAIEGFKAILSNSAKRSFAKNSDEQKRKYHDALRFLVHLVGDIHQPLHAAERNHDAGGNSVLVTWQGEPPYKYDPFVWNIHAVWDTYIVERTIAKTMKPAQRNYTDYAALLFTTLSPKRRDYAQLKSAEIETGRPETIIAWAEGSHRLAKQYAYNLPSQTIKKTVKDKPRDLVVLTDDYFTKENSAVVQDQLQLGGVRLARILNEIFDKDIAE